MNDVEETSFSFENTTTEQNEIQVTYNPME
jgi:hypothetical protein